MIRCRHTVTFAENATEGPVGGGAASVHGIISTLKGKAGRMAMIGKNPAGDWELSLPNDGLTKKRFEDIFFVITRPHSGKGVARVRSEENEETHRTKPTQPSSE